MKKLLVYFIVVLCIICSLFITVSAESNVEVFNPLDYGIVDFWTDNEGVTYDVNTPMSWAYSILARSRDLYILGGYSGQVVTYDSWVYDRDKVDLFAHPFGTNSSYWGNNGEKVKQGHLCDIRSIPRNTFFQSSFIMDFTNRNIDYSDITASYKLFFVNEDNEIVYRIGGLFDEPIVDDSSSTFVRLICHYSFNLKNFDIPGDAVALYPVYYIEDIDFSTDTVLRISYQQLRMGFSMSALALESQQNSNLQNTMDKINNSIDSAINGNVIPETPNNSGDFDELQGVESDLLDNVQNYLDDGMGFFDNAVGAIMGVANGFQAIKLLMAPVFNLPFANGLILVSVSLGLIATLLGIGIMASSSIHRKTDKEKYNKAYKEGYKTGFTKRNDKE